MFKTGLFPGPGGKGDFRKYPVWDENYAYDCWVEPFVAAGHQAHRYLANGIIKRAFVSDIDPKVRATWQVWSNPALRQEVAENINALSTRLITEPVAVYEEVRAVLDSGETEPIALATASLVARQFVFGNTLRQNRQGCLNVCASKDKTRSLKRKAGAVKNYPQLGDGFLEALNQGWAYEMPYFDPSWQVSFSNGWQKCIDAFEASDCQNAIAFIDPPYYVPSGSRPGRRGTGALTPAYTHHGDPQDKALLKLFLDCLERALANPMIKRVVATNYYSPELLAGVEALGLGGRQMWTTDLGTLQTMNNGVNGESRRDAPSELFIEFGGKRMAGRYEQKSLLELAA